MPGLGLGSRLPVDRECRLVERRPEKLLRSYRRDCCSCNGVDHPNGHGVGHAELVTDFRSSTFAFVLRRVDQLFAATAAAAGPAFLGQPAKPRIFGPTLCRAGKGRILSFDPLWLTRPGL